MSQVESSESIALQEKIKDASANIVAEMKLEIGELETEYITARREQAIGIFLFVLAFSLMYVFEFVPADPFTVSLVGIAFIYCVYTGFKLFSGKLGVISKYHYDVNKIIFAKVFSLLGLEGNAEVNEEALSLTPKTVTTRLSWWRELLRSLRKDETMALVTTLIDLEKSELVTEPHNKNEVDNVIEIKYQNSLIRVAEMDIRHETGSGKRRQINYIFHGYFVCFDLKKELMGKTFVTSEKEKNRNLDLDISFFRTKDKTEVRETVLEWNEFEDLLHVTTNNETEARYILTPNFMHDLYDWWRGRETNIRLSFIKNRLCILYPDKKIRLNQTVEKITEETVAEYLYTIAWPLQNVIKLIDDVKL